MSFRSTKYIQIVFLWFALLGVLLRLWIIPEITWAKNSILFMTSFLALNLIWYIHLRINRYLDRRLPFEKNVTWRLLAQLFGGWTVVKTILFVSGLFMINYVLPALRFSVNRLTLVTFTLAIFLANMAISLGLIAWQLFRRWKENELRAAQLEKEKTQVQYDNLRNQLNPHFLFNSLSSLDGLIEDDPALARQFLRQLSKVFRYVLQHKNKAVVALEDEVGFIRIYVSLLKTRFDGAFQVEFALTDEAMDAGIVPVTLQVLIENAIKHNVISDKYPLTIRIGVDDGYLSVSNTLRRKGRVDTSNGEGLANLKHLYGFLSTQPVEIVEEEETFCVRIPLLAVGQETGRPVVNV